MRDIELETKRKKEKRRSWPALIFLGYLFFEILADAFVAAIRFDWARGVVVLFGVPVSLVAAGIGLVLLALLFGLFMAWRQKQAKPKPVASTKAPNTLSDEFAFDPKDYEL